MPSITTHASLLSRLRDTSDNAAWREFDAKYGDLILHYCLARGLTFNDAEDVRQNVLLALAKAMPGFHYQPERGRFRTYLGKVVRTTISHFFKRARPESAHAALPIDEVASSASPRSGGGHGQDDDDEVVWNREWVRHHYRRAMQTVRATFEPKSVAVFDRLLGGESVKQVAAAFEVSEPAVHKIKQRIRNRLRELIVRQLRDEELPHA